MSLDLTAEPRFPRFLDELDRLDPRALATILPELIAELPAEQIRELVGRFGNRLESPDAIAETARNLFLAADDARWAYDYVTERVRTLRLADPVLTDVRLELAESGGRSDEDADLADEAARLIHNRIERGKLEEARARLGHAAGALSRHQRDRLYHQIADRLAAKRQHGQAAEVVVELAWAACETGDLEAATGAAERAVGLWRAGAHGAENRSATAAADAPVPPWLQQALDRVRAAWKACEELAEWRRTDEERRRDALRRRFLNQRILIAGGLRQPEWEARLAELTGAEIDWAESFRTESDDLSAYAARIETGRYAAVLHLVRKSGHVVGDKLKDACAAAGVPFVAARSAGLRGLTEALGSEL